MLFEDRELGVIARHDHIFEQIIGYVHGDQEMGGQIFDIVKTADMSSASNGLKIGGEFGRKFPGSDLENMGERLMRLLRLIIQDEPINRPGATFFCSGNYVYAVSKSVAEKLKAAFEDAGNKDIPHDNTRIFDELQQNGFAEPTSDGRAVHFIFIKMQGFEQKLSCLKFEARKLLANPPQINGELHEVDKDYKNHSLKAPDQNEIVPTTNHTQTEPRKDDLPQVKQADDDFSDVPDLAAKVIPERTATNGTQLHQAPFEKAPVSAKEPQTEQIEAINIENQNNQIEAKDIVVNRSGNLLFIVDYNDQKHLAIVTPKVFNEFACETNRYENDPNISEFENSKRGAKIVQDAMHKTKINEKIGGQQVHYYKMSSSPSPKAKLSLYLVKLSKIEEYEIFGAIKDIDTTTSIERKIKTKKI